MKVENAIACSDLAARDKCHRDRVALTSSQQSHSPKDLPVKLHIRRNRDTELYVVFQAKHQQRDLSLTNARVTFNQIMRELCGRLWVIRYGEHYISQ